MARMSIDDMVARDPRITMLTERLGWTRREVVGCLVQDVWPICYDQATHLISPKMIDIAAKHTGFADLMIDCELASRDRSGKLQVRGAKKRVKYIKDKEDAGREGGIKSAEVRRNKSKQTEKQTGKQAEAPVNPPDPVNANAPVPVPVVVPDPVPKNQKRSASPAPPGAQIGIDSFHEYFMRTHDGAKPSWEPKNVKRMHELVRVHGLEAVQRRISILETSPPLWPPSPWDLDTFAKHFDKVAAPSKGARGSHNDGMAELLALAGKASS